MQLQFAQNNCGAASLLNALNCLGIVSTQEEMGRLAKLGVDGIDEAGLCRAIKLKNLEHEHLHIAAPDRAYKALRAHLLMGHPVILAVDNSEHWVAAVGMLGDSVLIVDSADGRLLVPTPRKALLRRWKTKDLGRGEHPFFGVVVIPG